MRGSWSVLFYELLYQSKENPVNQGHWQYVIKTCFNWQYVILIIYLLYTIALQFEGGKIKNIFYCQGIRVKVLMMKNCIAFGIQFIRNYVCFISFLFKI